jgi:hypothetical protein
MCVKLLESYDLPARAEQFDVNLMRVIVNNMLMAEGGSSYDYMLNRDGEKFNEKLDELSHLSFAARLNPLNDDKLGYEHLFDLSSP